MKYLKSSRLLKKLDIPTFNYKKIANKELIETLKKDTSLGKELPTNIIMKQTRENLLENQNEFKDVEKLPSNIIIRNVEVKDTFEQEEILKYRANTMNNNPVNIISKNVTRDNETKTIFFYQDQTNYYELIYEFFEKVPYNDDEISAMIEAKNCENLSNIANSLNAIKVVLILMILIPFIWFILSLMMMN